MVGSSLSTIVIFLPFAFLTGVTGAFFQPLALTMAIALAISFVLAAVGVPIAVRTFASARAPHRAGAAPAAGARPFLFRHAWIAGLGCLALLGAGALLLGTLGSDFLPAMKTTRRWKSLGAGS